MTMQVLIVGAGGHGQVIADCLLRMADAGAELQPIGYVDDNQSLWGGSYLHLPVMGSLAMLDVIPHEGIILGIGNNAIRARLFATLCAQGERFITAIHPRAIVAPDVAIGPGTIVCAGAVINPGATLGCNVIINTAATVDHHNQIEDHAHIAPGAHLGGDVQVGEGALIGIGATVMAQRTVGEWAVVGAGAVVTRPVDNRTTVVGVPANLLSRDPATCRITRVIEHSTRIM